MELKRRSTETSRNLIAFSAGLLILLTVFLIVSPAAAQNNGVLQLNLGNQLVTGQLTNVNVGTDGSVSMTMALNTQIQTQYGPIPMTATGIWIGSINGTNVTGTIQEVTGTVRACFLFFCGSSNFIGQGKWVGSLNGSAASGSFAGTITFTSSSFSQVPLNQPQTVWGQWNANLQQPTN